jgi:hypothetical protein
LIRLLSFCAVKAILTAHQLRKPICAVDDVCLGKRVTAQLRIYPFLTGSLTAH